MIVIEKSIEFIERTSARLSWVPPLAARIVTGWVFVQAGWGKLHHLEQVTAYFESLGIPAAALQAPFVASVEFAGGLFILAGLLTRLAAFPLMGTMVVAILTAKLPEMQRASDLFGFSEFLYILLFFWLAVSGAGAVSLDAVLKRQLTGNFLRPRETAAAR